MISINWEHLLTCWPQGLESLVGYEKVLANKIIFIIKLGSFKSHYWVDLGR